MILSHILHRILHRNLNRIAPTGLILLAGPASAEFTLHVLHVNDLHSRIESVSKFDSTCDAAAETKGDCFGGVARLFTQINALRDQIRAAGGHVIVLDAGDQFQGALMYSTYKGAVEAEMMTRIGFDAMAVGNHEFDDGPDGLRAFVDKVDFPVISGNLDLSRSAALNGLVQPYAVLDIGGEKIGLVSALTTDTADIASPGDAVGFQDEITSLRGDVAALTAQGVDKIIALTHVGIAKDMQIAAAVPGIDAVVGGHSHTLMANTVAGAMAYPTMVGAVPVVQAYAYSKYLGHLVLTFDDAGVLTRASGDTILLGASVTPDAGVLARIAELAGPIAELKSRVVAETPVAIGADRALCRVQDCAMGMLIADAMLARVKDQGIEIAIQNGGGIRAAIDAGPITMGEVLTVLPFQNTLSTFRVTGANILAALENGVSQVADGAGRFPQVAGMTFVYDATQPVGRRVSDVRVGGVALDPARVYGVVSNNYVRNGGDGYRMFRDALDVYDFGPDLADVLADYLADNAADLSVAAGRITVK